MPDMAGCGQCPDQCSCVVANQCGEQYPGSGSSVSPLIIPERYDYPWVGASSDASIVVTPGDVRGANDCSDPDGHAPDLAVNFCALVQDEVLSGELLVLDPDDVSCRPHTLRDPLPDEVLSRDPGTGKAAWLGGVASFGGDVPYGVPLEFWGSEATVPSGYGLADFGLVDIADNPILFATIGFNASGGVDPGGGQFHKPDKRGVVAAGRDDMGGTPAGRVTDPVADTLGGVLGVESAPLTAANLPPHTHPLAIVNNSTGVLVVDAPSAVSVVNGGTGISIVSDGLHLHEPGTPARSFITATTANITNVAVNSTSPDNVTRWVAGGSGGPTVQQLDLGVDHSIVVSGAGANDSNPGSQLNNATTSSSGSHGHPISDPGHGHSVTNANHGHPISDPGHGHTGTANANAAHVADPVSRLQPTVFTNYIIRLG